MGTRRFHGVPRNLIPAEVHVLLIRPKVMRQLASIIRESHCRRLSDARELAQKGICADGWPGACSLRLRALAAIERKQQRKIAESNRRRRTRRAGISI